MSKLSSTRTALAAVVIIAAASPGCHPANPLVGKWQTTQSFMGQTITGTRQFNSDGTETLANPGGMGATIAYTIQGNQLHEKMTSITLVGHTITVDASSPDNAKKEMIETFTVDGDKLTLVNNTTGVAVTQNFIRVPAN